MAGVFPFVQREHVRFRDCDAMGHVNNAVYDYEAGGSVLLTENQRRRLAG